tara:strand:- start:667 stop:1446 length:780 start_codon:yes stop_codon:yes gene_type:complete
MYKLELSMPIKKRKTYLVLILAMLFLPLNTINLKAETKDCFEKLNRGVFQLNMVLDKALFRPIASGYSYLPSPIQKGVRNVTSNISHTVTIPNNLLQGNIQGALNETGRFAINTTFGIFGIFDPASKLGLKKNDPEDYGQTLGAFGVGPGCYVMLPIFGPSTIRDTFGVVGNTLLDPFYLSTVGDRNMLLDNNLGDRTYYIEEGFEKVDFRARNLKTFDDLEKNSIDLYSTVRSLYLQRRENLINNGASSDDDEWKDFK